MLRDNGREPAPEAPPGFWQQEDVREALRDREFGRVIRAYRKAVGISQLDMAHILGVSSQSDVSRIEHGRSGQDLARLQEWAQTLRVPRDMLWFALDHQPAPGHAHEASPLTSDVSNLAVVPTETTGGDHVQRRDLFKAAAGASAGAALSTLAPWQRLLDTIERGAGADETTLGMLETRTTEFFRSEEAAASSTIFTALTDHVATTRRLLTSTSREQDRYRLLSVAGESEALAGWLHYDQSRLREADTHYQRALDLAREASDGPLIATILNYRSYLLSAQDQGPDALQVLAEANQYVRGRSATTQAWIAGRHAEEAARLGDATLAERSIERAMDVYDYAHPFGERSWTSFFVPSRLGSLAVSTYGRIQHPATDELASSLLRTLPPTNNKLKAIVLADLALSAARGGDLDRASELTEQAAPLALGTEGSMAQDRLWEVTELLPAGGSGDALRKRLTNQLTSRT